MRVGWGAQTFGLFFKPMIEELGWSRSVMTGALLARDLVRAGTPPDKARNNAEITTLSINFPLFTADLLPQAVTVAAARPMNIPPRGRVPFGPPASAVLSWSGIQHAAQEQDRAGPNVSDEEDERSVDCYLNGVFAGT